MKIHLVLDRAIKHSVNPTEKYNSNIASLVMEQCYQLLHKGYFSTDDYHEIINKYGSAEAAPVKEG